MSYFQVEVHYEKLENKTADFQAVEFGIANAVFQALATRQNTKNVELWLVGNGQCQILICNKEEFLQALQSQQRQPQGRIMQPPPGMM